ncbi:DUF1330 domain-containing protein [Parasphingorhabdus sp.]|uniref:DUF1330 domain-containing protein n=1 Tax=Parasphingorhabdus sp. TaxID=2709688 RepID=UPI003BAE5820
MLSLRTTAVMLSLSAAFVFTPACSKSTQEAPNQATAAATSLKLKKGQVLSIILPQAKADASEARQQYYKQAFTLGAKFGLQREAVLAMDDVIISDYKPSGLIFYSYPDAASEKGLSSAPEWPAIKAMRPGIWQELKIYTAELDSDLDLNFDPDKSYTLVVAWLNPENPDDYQRYLKGIEPAVAAAGGRFIYKMFNPQYEANGSTNTNTAPGQLTFVEWDTLDGFTKVRTSAEYKANARYFGTGTTKVEFYRMKTRPQ